MSELQVTLLASLLRAFLVAALIAGWGFKKRIVLKAVAISLVLASLAWLIMSALFRPAILLVCLYLESRLSLSVTLALFFAGSLLVPLAIETWNNGRILKEEYSVRSIRKSTLLGHVFSTVVMVVYVLVSN